MTFARRKIDLTFLLGTGDFGQEGFNVLKVSGLRVNAQINKGGGNVLGQADVQVYGLTPDLLNRLTALTQIAMVLRRNDLTIEAGDDNGMAVVYRGNIGISWADLNDAPNSVLHVTAFSGLLNNLKPVPPISFPGTASVAAIMKTLADAMGLTFENNGVEGQLSNSYFPNTAGEQARRCAEHADINLLIDNETLAIWPKNKTRFEGVKPFVSVDSGMVGYPAFNGVGISVTSLFDPRIHFGQTVTVKSGILQACGDWNVNALSHTLASETPGGEWFTRFSGNPLTNINALPK